MQKKRIPCRRCKAGETLKIAALPENRECITVTRQLRFGVLVWSGPVDQKGCAVLTAIEHSADSTKDASFALGLAAA